ncbi:uncharacterized protein B0H18DRAFT_985160 [Fomitopsis serialis]|uniref:uncharacterized protein n=1 Tax=Fomitopsis serialis TaxID=139415 RepID=UPI002008C652|nr:uncharacterized protein B0H18DRAFT_985160 [Neoantrodia serialis]KAH9933017.1 hypothetical protein B0H18DRAFT_985160 [Neoantrodia serialis]
MWAWGIHINTWEHTWEVCRRISARAYADPTSPDGRLLIFYFQISDGSHKHGVDALKASAQKQGIDPLYAWSNAWRPLPFQDEIEGEKGEEGYGGYLPVVDVCEAVVKTGWRGPWSFETIHRYFTREYVEDDPDVPRRWTKSAKTSYDRIEEELRERGL